MNLLPMLWNDRSNGDWALPEPEELMTHEAIFGMAIVAATVAVVSPSPMTKMPPCSPPPISSWQTAL